MVYLLVARRSTPDPKYLLELFLFCISTTQPWHRESVTREDTELIVFTTVIRNKTPLSLSRFFFQSLSLSLFRRTIFLLKTAHLPRSDYWFIHDYICGANAVVYGSVILIIRQCEVRPRVGGCVLVFATRVFSKVWVFLLLFLWTLFACLFLWTGFVFLVYRFFWSVQTLWNLFVSFYIVSIYSWGSIHVYISSLLFLKFTKLINKLTGFSLTANSFWRSTSF